MFTVFPSGTSFLCIHPVCETERSTLFWSLTFASKTLWVSVMVLFPTLCSDISFLDCNEMPKPTSCNVSVDCCDRWWKLLMGCDSMFLLLVYETVWKNAIQIFLFPKLSWKIRQIICLMHIWLSVNFRFILWSLDTNLLTLQLFWIFSSWQLPISLDHLQGPHTSSMNLLNYSRQVYDLKVIHLCCAC